jgi:SRSO17 transposase
VIVIGHQDRAGPLRDYCLGLVMAAERKSAEPMAAITAPERTAAQHQSLLHFVRQCPWSDKDVVSLRERRRDLTFQLETELRLIVAPVSPHDPLLDRRSGVCASLPIRTE